MSAFWLDGRPPILLYAADVNPPNTVYRVKWGWGMDIVYSKRGNPAKCVHVSWELHEFSDNGFYKLIGILDPSILCRDDHLVSDPQHTCLPPSQEPPPTGQSPPPLVSLPEQQ